MSWIQTRSGEAFDLLNPKPEHVQLEDIVYALSHLCRFNGHTSRFYSVAEHSLHVCDRVLEAGHPARAQLVALLHDAHEAYTGDIASPLKQLLYIQNPAFSVVQPGEEEFVDGGVYGLEAKISQAVFKALIPGMADGVETPEEARAWYLADIGMLVTEAHVLFDYPPVNNWTKRYETGETVFRMNLDYVKRGDIKNEFTARYFALRDQVRKASA